MWLPVWENGQPLWVQDHHCYLDNGELAFINESIPTPLPAWLNAPAGSMVRMSEDDRHVAGGLLEDRSMEATADQIASFYQQCIRQGALTVQPDWKSLGLPGRCCPGFSANNDNDRLTVNVYQHKHLAFWTVYLSHKRVRKSASAPLTVIRRTADRVTLRYADDDDCWAPASALTDRYPNNWQRRRDVQREPDILPADGLPAWLKFSIDEDTPVVLKGFPEASATLERWEGRYLLPAHVNPYDTFNRWLDHLDACGLDATGLSGLYSYHLGVWQQGQMLTAIVQVDRERQGSISLLNCGEQSITATYLRKRPTA